VVHWYHLHVDRVLNRLISNIKLERMKKITLKVTKKRTVYRLTLTINNQLANTGQVVFLDNNIVLVQDTTDSTLEGYIGWTDALKRLENMNNFIDNESPKTVLRLFSEDSLFASPNENGDFIKLYIDLDKTL
jgi:hypothetical protein